MTELKIITLKDRRRQQILDNCLIAASRYALKCGRLTCQDEKLLNESWPDKTCHPPSWAFIRKNISIDNIKWYIHNHLISDDKIWTADFIQGIVRHGKVSWPNDDYPIVEWPNRGLSDAARKVIRTYPFGGKKVNKKWLRVSSLYLKYSEESISFMAGFLSLAIPFKLYYNNWVFKMYVRFPKEARPILEKWGIPIEHENFRGIFIAPIWPALLSPWMPEDMKRKWSNVKSDESRTYAVVLWNTYVNTHFKTDGIPYLKSERKIYRDYKCEMGAIKYIEKLRVDLGLTELDNRFREIVQFWYNRGKEENNEIHTN